MLDIVKFAEDKSLEISLLDFGCGAAHLLQYIKDKRLDTLKYSGLDVSDKFVSLSKEKFPGTSFYTVDILDMEVQMPHFDYVVMNGVFTEKRELSFTDMWNYFCQMLTRVFDIADKGIAFNVMSKAVEWERDDLFHLPTDMLIDFLTKKLSRNLVIRNDYGLYEFTTYIL